MRAFHRSYVHEQRRARQVTRLHILRETGPSGGRGALCGTTGYNTVRSEVVLIDPLPETPPAGLTWCPHCLGRASELAGLLAAFGKQLAAQAVTP